MLKNLEMFNNIKKSEEKQDNNIYVKSLNLNYVGKNCFF